MATKEKNFWVFLIFMLAGLVLGGLLGQIASSVDWLWWLGYGQEFGIVEPMILDLNVLKLTFAMMIKINIASIIGLIIAVFAYRKV